tara:strand:+ start:2088 stop:2654 length:567 start_codon:yes stop_codon:yes gene_type:complete
MNIFILDNDPKKCATLMMDKHVVKMPTESLQMLSTIAHHLGHASPYKPVMLNHPCTIWARQSQDNFSFLLAHTEALCAEYTLRYGKTHKVETTLLEYEDAWVSTHADLPNIGLTPHAVAISPEMKCRKIDGFDDLTTVEKYRHYYIEDKWWFAEWKTQKPEWWPVNHYNIKMREIEVRRNSNVMDRKI